MAALMMETTLLGLGFGLFAFTFWLGGYLIVRNPAKLAMHLAGWGLIAYACTVALNTLAGPDVIGSLRDIPLQGTGIAGGPWLVVRRIMGVVPATLWIVSIALLLRNGDHPLAGRGVQVPRAEGTHRRPLGLLIMGALFFALSMASFIARLIPMFWALIIIGFDMALLGYAVARLDAFDEGEAFATEFARSLVGSGVMALMFGGAVTAAAIVNGGWTPSLQVLAFVVIALAIDAQLFAPRLQSGLDKLILPARVQQQRAELRETAEVLARVDDGFDLNALDEAEFARLTRRALSHMTDLPKLAASPLTLLPVVAQHLAAHGMPDTPLDRASALKAVLTQCIAKLKPDSAAFGMSDAWRHYNALFFPYVVGLKPYSARATLNGHDTDATAKAALAWFQAAVPERTLHNWQNAAAKMVARELRAPVTGR